MDENTTDNWGRYAANNSNGKNTALMHINNHNNSRAENLQKHVLSPRLVDAIAKTTQVVWANSKKQEGLIGRSDIRLQTAVGMPVAMDDRGNMCVVVMFSPNNIQSTNDAIDFLQSISRSATTSSIPCLLPVFNNTSMALPISTSNSSAGSSTASGSISQLTYPGFPHNNHNIKQGETIMNSLGEGVVARFVSFDGHQQQQLADESDTEAEVHNLHELTQAPKDTFGIPMLPSFAELGNNGTSNFGDDLDVFDEASYGIWTTIMDTLPNGDQGDQQRINDPMDFTFDAKEASLMASSSLSSSLAISDLQNVILPDAAMPECRKTRLEEFCVAFLDMSVFDLADVWVPVGNDCPDCLRHVTSVASTERNVILDDFATESSKTLIKFWMGAVGRAYSSGNPVWSANPSVFVDPGRSNQFDRSKILTVLAVPVFSGKSPTPACVVACYSLVRSGSVPFVLRFVQQALRLLWDGLDKLVEPNENEGRNIWHDVAPADLGEMAADVEMQHHFMHKKRSYSCIGNDVAECQVPVDTTTASLVSHLQAVRLPNGDTVNVPFELPPDPLAVSFSHGAHDLNAAQIHEPFLVTAGSAPSFPMPTNMEGTKRANIIPMRPLQMPHSFPTTIVSSDTVTMTNKIDAHQSTREPFALSAAVFVFPPAPVFDLQHATNTELDYRTEVGPPTVSPSISVASMVDSKIYCTNVNDCSLSNTHPPEILSFGNKQCRIIGCDELCVVRRPYCVQHSGNRICEFDGCNKCAQGSTRYCIAHGGGRRCTHPGCDKGARDKFFCAAHGGGKRCISYGCIKSAVGGSTLCTAHGGGRRCDVEGCDKSAQSSTRYCVKHGGGKKCSLDGCEKVARGRTHFCAAHGGGVRCKLEGCNRVAIGKMQLCRAHGGGARIRRASRAVLPNSSVVTGASMMMITDPVG